MTLKLKQFYCCRSGSNFIMTREEYVEIVEKNYKSHADLPDIIILLKDLGASQIDTMSVIRRCVDISIPELDDLVLNSPAWSHMKDINLKLRDDFFNSLEDHS